jgi:hypothetical protein
MISFASPFGPDDPFVGPTASILIAHGPDYRPPREDIPLFAHDWDELLAQCRTALDRRVAAYPGMIAKRVITADDARRDIAAWQTLVREWHWILSGTGQPPSPLTMPDRMAALDLAMTRVRQEIGRGNRTHANYRQAHLIQALHWHLVHRDGLEPRVYWTARLNHALYAERGDHWCEDSTRWISAALPASAPAAATWPRPATERSAA